MTKIMLVEDDKSLREIYGVRLLAEGYDIVSAADGEEALAMAIKERPALIISDVMMPRISGFDMLDILRSTTETKNIKVIMMTALSSEDQRKHGEQLGADRYLVKSQVGIEDVVRVVHEVLGDGKTPPPPAPTASSQAPANPVSAPPSISAGAPAQPQQSPASLPKPAAPGVTPAAVTPPTLAADPVVKVVPPSVPPIPPMPPKPSMPPAQTTAPVSAGTRQRVIQPINDPTQKIDINNLLDKELAREAGVDVNNLASAPTVQAEKAAVQDQLRSLNPPIAPLPPAPASQIPTAPAVNVVPPPTPAAQPPAQPTQARPPVQAPPRPNIAPVQPRQGGIPPAPGV